MTHDALSIAYHEAGHAVVGRSFGCDIGCVWIRLDDSAGGSDIDVDGLDARQKGLLALAGAAAQIQAGYAITHNEALLTDNGHAFEAIDDMTGLFPGDDGLDDAYDTLEKETKELVRRPDIWAAIEALAPVLAEHHAIDGVSAMAIIDPLLSDRRIEN
jgi:hypothetical protein